LVVVVVVITDVKIIVISEIPTYYQKYFNQKAIFFFRVIFYAFNLQHE
jgi:hypothetical protein